MFNFFEYNESNIKAKTRKKILDNTMNLFIRDGIYSPTMQTIAKNSEVSLRSLYYYYKNKEELAVDIQIIAMSTLGEVINSFKLDDSKNAYENLVLFYSYLLKHMMVHQKVIKYITAFDYYFFNEYPTAKYNDFLNKMKNDSLIFKIFELSIKDNSIEFYDIDPFIAFTTIFQSLLAYAQKIIYREKAMLSEDIQGRGDIEAFIKLMLEGLKKR